MNKYLKISLIVLVIAGIIGGAFFNVHLGNKKNKQIETTPVVKKEPIDVFTDFVSSHERLKFFHPSLRTQLKKDIIDYSFSGINTLPGVSGSNAVDKISFLEDRHNLADEKSTGRYGIIQLQNGEQVRFYFDMINDSGYITEYIIGNNHFPMPDSGNNDGLTLPSLEEATVLCTKYSRIAAQSIKEGDSEILFSGLPKSFFDSNVNFKDIAVYMKGLVGEDLDLDKMMQSGTCEKVEIKVKQGPFGMNNPASFEIEGYFKFQNKGYKPSLVFMYIYPDWKLGYYSVTKTLYDSKNDK